jgi:hypothetical protein
MTAVPDAFTEATSRSPTATPLGTVIVIDVDPVPFCVLVEVR